MTAQSLNKSAKTRSAYNPNKFHSQQSTNIGLKKFLRTIDPVNARQYSEDVVQDLLDQFVSESERSNHNPWPNGNAIAHITTGTIVCSKSGLSNIFGLRFVGGHVLSAMERAYQDPVCQSLIGFSGQVVVRAQYTSRAVVEIKKLKLADSTIVRAKKPPIKTVFKASPYKLLKILSDNYEQIVDQAVIREDYLSSKISHTELGGEVAIFLDHRKKIKSAFPIINS